MRLVVGCCQQENRLLGVNWEMAAVSYTCGGQRPLSAWFNNRLTILDRVLPHEGKSRRLRDAVRSELRARIEGRLADLNKAEVITKGL